jgi:cytoplasmic iron level regulating protein YaaA (DUF328/UPF0246 family)
LLDGIKNDKREYISTELEKTTVHEDKISCIREVSEENKATCKDFKSLKKLHISTAVFSWYFNRWNKLNLSTFIEGKKRNIIKNIIMFSNCSWNLEQVFLMIDRTNLNIRENLPK